jgi:hypothetical protein
MLGLHPMDKREAEDQLFAASLDAFVETRARLAAALAAAGHKEDGQALKKVRRPSASAWATNQVVRRARDALDLFLEASTRLRGSQGAIIAGRGDRGVYQADVEELRRAAAGLAEAARRVLAEAGRAEDRALVDRVVANARAAALTDAGRQALQGGALQADLDGGAEAFGGLFTAAPTDAAPPAPVRSKPPEVVAAGTKPSARELEAQRRQQRQEAEEKERERALTAARRDEAEAREAVAATGAAAGGTRAALDEARRRLDEAQQAARDAERALRDADAAHRTAQRDATLAETRAGRATRRREELEK